MKHRKERRRRLGGIFGLIRRRTHRLFGFPSIKNDAHQRQKMNSSGNYGSEGYNSLSGFGSGGAREPGARRKKFAGYLRAANELRQSYQQSYGSPFSGNSRDASTDHIDEMSTAFPEAAIVRGGNVEMIIFPSYARKHVKQERESDSSQFNGPGPQDAYSMRDPDYWRYQEERYEEEVDAVVDVDVRGWLYSPQRGPMNRKQRLFIGLARQLSGLPAAPSAVISPTTSRSSSRSSSPHTAHRQRMEMRAAKQEEEEVSKEAQAILRRGEREADIAGRGGFSEPPMEDAGITHSPGREQSPHPQPRVNEPQPGHFPHPVTETSLPSGSAGPVSATEIRQSWSEPANMGPAELTEANNHLMARLRPFLANPLVDTAVSAFFYNDSNSEQRTITTNTSGHFSIRAALAFVPTHVRLLASEGGLSALQEVHVTQPNGVSLISDIDDTVKHSAINSGAKEIFRNTFIRSLSDLTVEGVREWYKRMADLGVKLHYVSNSPWQLYPLLTSYFAKAELPPGSFHLKQYTGVLQGIFEPVAERKKSSMDRILRDFPDRQFILVGDSGEADLEVYTNTVLENPGRILGIFIRDVTTSKRKRFFDATMGPLRGESSPKLGSGSASPNGWRQNSRSMKQTSDEDDPHLRAAIAASLEDVEKQRQQSIASMQSSHTTQSGPHIASGSTNERRPPLPPRRPTEPPAPQSHQIGPTMGNLIDLGEAAYSEDQEPVSEIKENKANGSALKKTTSNQDNLGLGFAPLKKTPSPTPPPKPLALRGSNSQSKKDAVGTTSPDRKKPPPPPSSRKPVSKPKSGQQDEAPPLPNRPQNSEGYTAAARQKIADTYQSLPSPASFWSTKADRSRPSSPNRSPSEQHSPRNMSVSSIKSEVQSKQTPPPPPPRRAISSYPAAAAQYASKRLSWNSPPASPKLTGTDRDAHEPALSPRERAWRERWARAKQILDAQGVMLRSWRVGFDAMDDAIGLVERALRDIEQEDRTGKTKQGRR